MGIKLHATFLAAGLRAPSMKLEAIVGGESSDRMNLVADLVGTLLPDMERLGIAAAAEVEFETLTERMTKEAIGSTGVIVGRSEIGAWSNG